MEIIVQLLVGEWDRRLVEWVFQAKCAHIRKMLLQDSLSGIEADERIVNGHGKIAGCFVFMGFHIEFGGQDLPDLGVQHRDGCGFGAGQSLLQGDGVFELPSFLQDLDDHRERARFVK
jgi:hypothetical protein